VTPNGRQLVHDGFATAAKNHHPLLRDGEDTATFIRLSFREANALTASGRQLVSEWLDRMAASYG